MTYKRTGKPKGRVPAIPETRYCFNCGNPFTCRPCDYKKNCSRECWLESNRKYRESEEYKQMISEKAKIAWDKFKNPK